MTSVSTGLHKMSSFQKKNYKALKKTKKKKMKQTKTLPKERDIMITRLRCERDVTNIWLPNGEFKITMINVFKALRTLME